MCAIANVAVALLVAGILRVVLSAAVRAPVAVWAAGDGCREIRIGDVHAVLEAELGKGLSRTVDADLVCRSQIGYGGCNQNRKKNFFFDQRFFFFFFFWWWGSITDCVGAVVELGNAVVVALLGGDVLTLEVILENLKLVRVALERPSGSVRDGWHVKITSLVALLIHVEGLQRVRTGQHLKKKKKKRSFTWHCPS